ncbi:MAG: GntR family transcriptional regulator [Desulfobacter sp.]
MGLKKISKPEPLSKTALRMLRQSILANELETGVIYNEKGLAADLGISRTPVREALLELSAKKLIRFLPQKGVVINTFSDEDIEDVFEIRTALEIFSIKKICGCLEKEDLSRLKGFLTAQKKAAAADDRAGFMAEDNNYHIGFTSLTGNNYLIEMMQNIRDIMHLMGARAIDLEGRMQEVVKEHEAIMAAISREDVSAAIGEMVSHLEKSKAAVKKVYGQVKET